MKKKILISVLYLLKTPQHQNPPLEIVTLSLKNIIKNEKNREKTLYATELIDYIFLHSNTTIW